MSTRNHSDAQAGPAAGGLRQYAHVRWHNENVLHVPSLTEWEIEKEKKKKKKEVLLKRTCKLHCVCQLCVYDSFNAWKPFDIVVLFFLLLKLCEVYVLAQIFVT